MSRDATGRGRTERSIPDNTVTMLLQALLTEAAGGGQQRTESMDHDGGETGDDQYHT